MPLSNLGRYERAADRQPVDSGDDGRLANMNEVENCVEVRTAFQRRAAFPLLANDLSAAALSAAVCAARFWSVVEVRAYPMRVMQYCSLSIGVGSPHRLTDRASEGHQHCIQFNRAWLSRHGFRQVTERRPRPSGLRAELSPGGLLASHQPTARHCP